MWVKYSNKEDIFSSLIILIFTFGLIFHLVPITLPIVLKITDITTLLSNSIVLFFLFRSQKNKALIYWSFATFILTYLTELAGVKTGLIFGEYHYGDTMLIQLFDVPVVIGLNWVILMLGSYSIVQWFGVNRRYLIPLLSSLLIVAFDFVMEKVAMSLDYWQWKDNIVPLQNYIAWFFISLLFSSLLSLLKVNIESRIVRIYFLVQLFFFIILRLAAT